MGGWGGQQVCGEQGSAAKGDDDVESWGRAAGVGCVERRRGHRGTPGTPGEAEGEGDPEATSTPLGEGVEVERKLWLRLETGHLPFPYKGVQPAWRIADVDGFVMDGVVRREEGLDEGGDDDAEE